MNSIAKKQQGMTLITMACVVIVVVSIFMLALKILPIYVDHKKITGALEAIKTNPEARNESPDQIDTRLFKLLQVNNADDVIKKDDVDIAKLDNGSTQIHIQYKVIKQLVGNASILVEFDDKVEIR